MNTPMVDNAKVMAKGQVTIPIDIRKKLNISEGDRLTFICNNDKVIMMNSALYAMKVLQEEMKNEAEKAGLYSDDDVVNMIMKMRAGDEDDHRQPNEFCAFYFSELDLYAVRLKRACIFIY